MRSSEEIKIRIRKKEERLGRELSKMERRKIEKKVIAKHRRENIIRGLFLSIGIAIGAMGTKALDSGKMNNTNQPVQEADINSYVEKESNEFRESLYVDSDDLNKQPQNEKIDYNQIEQEIINEYNQEYNDNLTQNEISIISSKPQFVGIDKDNNYIQDYKEETPVVQYKTSGIGDIYVAIDNRNNSIIYSVGRIDDKVVNVDTKVVMTNNNGQLKEYFESNKKIDPTKNKDEKTINNIYDTLKYEFEKQHENEKSKE